MSHVLATWGRGHRGGVQLSPYGLREPWWVLTMTVPGLWRRQARQMTQGPLSLLFRGKQ